MKPDRKNEKGSTEAATSPSPVQSSIPTKGREKMNSAEHSTDHRHMPTLSRRSLLSALAATAVPALAFGDPAENSADPQHQPVISIDDFLARATAAERASYHANALAEVMAEMHPDRCWRSSLNHEHKFALIVGDDRPVFVVRQEA